MQWLAAAIERVAAVADASPVLSLGVLLLCGYFAGRLAGLIRLPSITGYIVAGLVLGDSVVGLISHHATARLQPVTEVALAFIAITIGGEFRQLFMVLEPVTPPIFALFFILAGAELQLAVFAEVTVVILGLAYLAARFAGKFTGAYVGARVMGAPDAVRRYLGFCLFPQAGVAIGLALFLRGSSMVATAGADVQRLVTQLVNIVLVSVFINELFGPLISRYGVTRGVAAQR